MRGPVGRVPGPPRDLGGRVLLVRRVRAGKPLFRIHRAAHGPIFFSPGVGPPQGRYDATSGRFGVLYAARRFAVAFAETLLRKPAERFVAPGEVAARCLSRLTSTGPLLLVDLTGPGLSSLGLDARFLSGPYDVCGAWSDALHDHPQRPDGLLYPSRLDPSDGCVALFDRVSPRLAVLDDPVPLATMPGEVAAALDRHGKALLPDLPADP